RFDMSYFQTGLFAHLAHRGVFGAFPLLDMTFRQRPGVGSFGANQHELKSAVVPAPVYEAARGYFAPDRQLGARALVVSVFGHQPTSPRLKPSESIRRIALRAPADEGLWRSGSRLSHPSASSRDRCIRR